MKPLFEFKKTKPSNFNKPFVNRVEQDNQVMLKRLNDQPSIYNKKNWYKDYEKSQEYKKNICVFPSIKFFKDFENERNLHSSQQRKIEGDKISGFGFSKTNGFFNSNKKRSSTSYAKFKDTEKLYGSRYFQNTEESSN